MVGGKRINGVRAATDTSIEIDFYYRGVRCRERLKLPPTPRHMQFAKNLRGQVLVEIEKGTFDYAEHFPDSAKAKIFAKNPGGLTTVATILWSWYDEKALELEHSTLIGYKRIIKNILVPQVGALQLREFTRRHAKKLITSLGTEVSAKRINNVLGPLRGAFDEAIRDNLIKDNPMAGLKVKRRAKPDESDKIDPFTPAEVQLIIAKAEGQFHNYCQFDFASGLRTSEMIGLQWPDVDLAKCTATIRRAHVMGKTKATKTDAGKRVITLLPPALAALKAQQAYTRLAGGAVFHNPATGEPWASDKQIREWNWRPVLKAAGVRYRYPYQMRHTYASQALSAGENVMWVADQMGHKDWTVTARRYSRWIPSIAPESGAKVAALWLAPVE